MTTPYNHSKSIYSNRMPIGTQYPVGEEQFMFSLGTETGLSYDRYYDAFTVNGIVYYNRIGIRPSYDYYEISQDIDLTSIDALGGIFRFRLIDDVFNGNEFWFIILIDGNKRAWHKLDNRDLTLFKLQAPCPDLTGTHTVTFRLELD